MGKIENQVINNSHNDFSFTYNIIKNYFKNVKSNKDLKDNFQRFYKFNIDYKTYYIPSDLTTQNSGTNEELTLHILNKQQDEILKYDYSNYEESYSQLHNKFINYLKEKANKSHSMFVSKEDKLKRVYQNFHPNRDFSDSRYFDTLKRPDDINGEYIDNGYR